MREPAAEVLWLGEPRCGDRRVAGGKAAALSRLAAAHRVPPGFCVRLGQPAGSDGTRALLHAAYARLGELTGAASPIVAVRSSAVDEDGEAVSFAGQHETKLGVQGLDDVLEAILQCAASARADRALQYRRRHGLQGPPGTPPVLVQQMVPAEVSVVAFTAHPVTGRRDEVVIDASWGLGESIVGGIVTPDTYVVERDRLRVRSRSIADKRRMTVVAAGGTRQVDVPEARRAIPALDDQQIRAVARLALELERLENRPVDMEAGLARGMLHLLQCRPITTPLLDAGPR